MIRQQDGDGCATSQRSRNLVDVLLHFRAFGHPPVQSHTNAEWGVVSMCPQVLVLQVDELLRITQRAAIGLGDALNSTLWVKRVGVLRDRAYDLHEAVTFQRRWEWVFGNEQAMSPLMSLNDIIPSLAEIALHIPDGWPFD